MRVECARGVKAGRARCGGRKRAGAKAGAAADAPPADEDFSCTWVRHVHEGPPGTAAVQSQPSAAHRLAAVKRKGVRG